jgi:hypothetical protein
VHGKSACEMASGTRWKFTTSRPHGIRLRSWMPRGAGTRAYRIMGDTSERECQICRQKRHFCQFCQFLHNVPCWGEEGAVMKLEQTRRRPLPAPRADSQFICVQTVPSCSPTLNGTSQGPDHWARHATNNLLPVRACWYTAASFETPASGCQF